FLANIFQLINVLFVFLWKVHSKPEGKYDSLHMLCSLAEKPSVSDGDGAILLTNFPFEASSPDAGDKDAGEGIGQAVPGAVQVSDVGQGNTLAPVLLSEDALSRLLQGSEQEQQDVGEDEDKLEEEEEEAGRSSESETPVALDYTANSEAVDPSPTKVEETSKAEDEEKVGAELPTAMADYDSQESLEEAEDPREGSQEADQAEELWDTEKRECYKGPEAEKGTSDRGSHAKGSRRKAGHMRKEQNSSQSGQASGSEVSSGRAQRPEPEKGPDSKLNMEHKGKRRHKKWVRLGITLTWQRFVLDPDPCENFPCKSGRKCKLNEEMEPSCLCQEPAQCPSENLTELEHVCGTDNQTYQTSCHLFATKCHLEGTKKGHRLHLDYSGPCKFIPPCLNTELQQFPLRMRDWLKNILLQLYEHDSVTPGLLTAKQRARVQKLHDSERRLHVGSHAVELLALDFEKNYNLYIYPVHWQFAQLDQHPTDRVLTHSELAPLRASLVPMEHCTSVFFRRCDTDRDRLLSLREWCQCFGLKHEDMERQLLF
uniref:SPARC-like 1 n=1 Tax=Electrophorus electricus TaxID=8005 RepID=A0A4W4GGN7_ELEEL